MTIESLRKVHLFHNSSFAVITQIDYYTKFLLSS